MIKDLVPYQPSLDLKELGFNEPCFGYYENGVFIFKIDSQQEKELLLNCSAPLYQQVFRFFREKHNLMFQIFYLRNGNYAVLIHRTTPEYMNLVDQIKPSSGCVDEVVDCYSYEEAELDCLLKLIEIVKQQKQ